jgi:2-hydroxychromene-2-carboxylate isomerase
VQFWFEFASTYSYPAACRIERLARDTGVELEWKPFLLGPIFKSQGWSDSPFNVYPAKGRYMWRDLERICEDARLPFKRPSQFPRNGLTAARLVCALRGAPWIPAFVRAVYAANFADDRDIADPGVLRSVLESIGQPAALLERASAEEAKAALRANTDEAMRLGMFGAPTFMRGAEMYWGNDRLEQALRAR